MIDFIAHVSAEIPVGTDHDEVEYQEIEFSIGLECTHNSYPGSFSPIDGGSPPEAAEYEPVEIVRDDTDEVLTWGEFVALVGDQRAIKMLEDAFVKADESGEF